MPRATNKRIAHEDTVLSIAKLHRVLRPLRTKVVALAAVLNQPSVQHAILSNRSFDISNEPSKHNVSDHDPSSSSPTRPINPSSSPDRPRAIKLDSSYMFGHSAYLPSNTAAVASAGIRPSGSEGPSTDAVRISSAVGLGIAHAKIGDKIASVVAAFTVVLRAANPSRTTAPAGGKLPSLRALCGSLIGPQIEQSVASKRDEEGEEHEEDDESNEWASEEEEDDDSAVVDQWYESIPEHLRRYVLVSHSIEITDRLLPIALPRLWEDLLDCCSAHGNSLDYHQVMNKLLVAIVTRKKPLPIAEQTIPPSYLALLLRRYATAVSRWTNLSSILTQATVHEPSSGADDCAASASPVPISKSVSDLHFVRILSKALGSPSCVVGLKNPCVHVLLNAITDPFAQLSLFDALLSTYAFSASRLPTPALVMGHGKRNEGQLRKWISRLLALDLALPPDEELDPLEAEQWVHLLAGAALRLLDIVNSDTVPAGDGDDRTLVHKWGPAALTLGLHALVRFDPVDGDNSDAEAVRGLPTPEITLQHLVGALRTLSRAMYSSGPPLAKEKTRERKGQLPKLERPSRNQSVSTSNSRSTYSRSGVITDDDDPPLYETPICSRSSIWPFGILFPCLGTQYFFDAVKEYTSALRPTLSTVSSSSFSPWSRLVSSKFEKKMGLPYLEVLFLSSALAFAEHFAEPTKYDPDPDPLLDYKEIAEIKEWLTDARKRAGPRNLRHQLMDVSLDPKSSVPPKKAVVLGYVGARSNPDVMEHIAPSKNGPLSPLRTSRIAQNNDAKSNLHASIPLCVASNKNVRKTLRTQMVMLSDSSSSSEDEDRSEGEDISTTHLTGRRSSSSTEPASLNISLPTLARRRFLCVEIPPPPAGVPSFSSFPYYPTKHHHRPTSSTRSDARMEARGVKRRISERIASRTLGESLHQPAVKRTHCGTQSGTTPTSSANPFLLNLVHRTDTSVSESYQSDMCSDDSASPSQARKKPRHDNPFPRRPESLSTTQLSVEKRNSHTTQYQKRNPTSLSTGTVPDRRSPVPSGMYNGMSLSIVHSEIHAPPHSSHRSNYQPSRPRHSHDVKDVRLPAYASQMSYAQPPAWITDPLCSRPTPTDESEEEGSPEEPGISGSRDRAQNGGPPPSGVTNQAQLSLTPPFRRRGVPLLSSFGLQSPLGASSEADPLDLLRTAKAKRHLL